MDTSQGHGETESRVPRVTYVKWLRGRTIPRSRYRLRSQLRAVSVRFLQTLIRSESLYLLYDILLTICVH